MTLGTVFLILLIVILLGGVPTGFYGGGPYLGGGLGLVLAVVLVLFLLGRI